MNIRTYAFILALLAPSYGFCEGAPVFDVVVSNEIKELKELQAQQIILQKDIKEQLRVNNELLRDTIKQLNERNEGVPVVNKGDK